MAYPYRYPYYNEFPYKFCPAVDCVNENGIVVCPPSCPDHGRAVVRRTSRSRWNPGKDYYCCSHGRCFWKWADDHDLQYLLTQRQARWRPAAAPASQPLPRRRRDHQPERRRTRPSHSPPPAPRAAQYNNNNNNTSYHHPLPRPPVSCPSPDPVDNADPEEVAFQMALQRSLRDQKRVVIEIDDDEEEGRDSDVEIILEAGRGKGKKRIRDLSDGEEDVEVVAGKRERSTSSNRLRTPPPSKDAGKLKTANKKINSLEERVKALEKEKSRGGKK